MEQHQLSPYWSSCYIRWFLRSFWFSETTQRWNQPNPCQAELAHAWCCRFFRASAGSLACLWLLQSLSRISWDSQHLPGLGGNGRQGGGSPVYEDRSWGGEMFPEGKQEGTICWSGHRSSSSQIHLPHRYCESFQLVSSGCTFSHSFLSHLWF